MAQAVARVCRCGARIEPGQRCQRCTTQRYRADHTQRTDDQPWRRWYWTQRWRKASKAYIAAHPLCEICRQQGRVELAEVVDHIVPHKGDERLFWDEANWRALSRRCHDRYGAK